MKKHILIIFSLLPTFMFAQITGQVHWNANDISFEKIDGYDKIISNNNYSYKIGAPELPILVQSWVIPVDAAFKDITITENNRIKLNGEYNIYPVQASQPTNYTALHDFTEPAPAIYNQTSPYPNQRVKLVRDGITMGYHIVTVEIYPLEYIPNRKELYLSDIDYTINYTFTKRNIISNAPKQSSFRRVLTKEHIASMVENPNDLEKYAPHSNRMLRSSSIIEELSPDYVIITNETLKPYFQRLADWKTKKGLSTIITTVEDINKDYRGSDLQEKIRNYLLGVKDKWGEGLFLLLGGDINIVPSKIVKGEHSILRPADLYYNSLTIKWNPVTNELYNDKNKDFMFYMGRASVENTIEAGIFIDKVLKYEKLPSNIDYSYFNNYLAADGFISKDTTGYLSDGAMISINNIFNNTIANNVNRWYQFDHFFCSQDDHDKYTFSKNHGEELNQNNVISALNTGGNSGLNHFHFVYHMDHSSPTGMGTSSKDKNEYITCAHADQFSNGDYLQIIMSGGCEPADFSKDCIAEHFLNNSNGGAVAFIGNSDEGRSNEWSEFREFGDALFKKANRRAHYNIAIPFQNSYKGVSPHHSDWRYHLLGDPEMPVWTATPQNLNVSVTTSQEEAGNSYIITVQINNLPVGQDALVCLMKGTEYYTTETIEDTQPHQFRVIPKTSGDLDVTITAHNFRPFETTVPINAGSQPLISMETGIRDSGRGTKGNGDRHLDAGETVLLSAKLYSATERTLTNTKFNLNCSAPEVTILKDTITSNTVTLTPTVPKTVWFTITIDSLCSEKLKNDLNPVRFELYMQSDDNDWEYQDAFNAEIFAPEIESGNQKITATSNGNLSIEANETIYFTVDLTNIGKAEAVGLTGKISTSSPYISECNTTAVEFPDILKYETKSNAVAFQFKTTANYTLGQPLPLTLTVRNRYGKTWELALDPANRPTVLPQSSLSFKGYEKAIDLTWSTNASLNYNVYRSDTETGEFVKVNAFPLSISYFKDENLNPYSTYYYKVAAINASGNEGPLSNSIKAWTVCPSLPMFPVIASQEQGLFYSRSSVATYDIDNDGKLELFSTQVAWKPSRGRIIALDSNGKELYEADGNVTTYNGFGTVNEEIRVTPTVTDLKSNGEPQLIVAPRELPGNIRCYSMNERDDNDSPILLWEKPASAKYLHNPVTANVDNSSDGSKEVVLASCEHSGGVLILDYNGNELCRIDTITRAYSAPAVADLDGDGDMEIVIGNDNGVHIWHHDGTPFSTGNPLFTEAGYKFGSSPIVCDIDRDGQKEILIVGKKNAASGIPTESIVYAINTDGTLVQGWNKTQKSSFVGSSFCQDMAVGDLNNDGKLEVVVRGRNDIKVWNNRGILLLNQPAVTYNGRMNPILADIDGDGEAEIIFGTELQSASEIYGINLDGTDVAGFPLSLDYYLRNSVNVSDIDNDGKNELIAIADNAVYAWKTEGKAGCIEWGVDRGNNDNTGEYTKECRPTLIQTNTVWDGESPCGNILIQSGNLTLPSGTTMNLNGTSKITVRAGGTLTVDGATINNASVWAQSGSHIIIRNGGTVNLRSSGNFIIDKGATLDYRQGGIMPD